MKSELVSSVGDSMCKASALGCQPLPQWLLSALLQEVAFEQRPAGLNQQEREFNGISKRADSMCKGPGSGRSCSQEALPFPGPRKWPSCSPLSPGKGPILCRVIEWGTASPGQAPSHLPPCGCAEHASKTEVSPWVPKLSGRRATSMHPAVPKEDSHTNCIAFPRLQGEFAGGA